MINITSKYFSFLTINRLQAESRIQQGIFLHVFPVGILQGELPSGKLQPDKKKMVYLFLLF